MSAGGFEADTEARRQAGERLVDVAGRLDTRWQALLADATGRGDIFGDDMVGGLIGASYFGAQDVADEAFVSAVDGLLFCGETLGVDAKLHESTEEQTTTDIASLPVDGAF